MASCFWERIDVFSFVGTGSTYNSQNNHISDKHSMAKIPSVVDVFGDFAVISMFSNGKPVTSNEW